MTPRTERSTDTTDPDPGPDGTRIDWHRHDAGQQLIVSVGDGDVRVAVALPTDASRSSLDDVLATLERELDHYCETDAATSPARG